MEGDARAFAPVISESRDLTVTETAEALSRDFQNESGPVENRTPSVKEKEADPLSLSDDTKVTLKDGAELSLRELKRGYISRKTFTAKTQALATERARFVEFCALTQHHSTLNAALRQVLETVLTVLLPRQPDPSLIDADPQLFKAQHADYESKMGLIAQAHQAVQAEFNAAQAARNAAERGVIQQQTERLLEAMPELAKANVSRRFQEDAIDTMAEYGFSVEELSSSLKDWRNFRIVRDLTRYRNVVKATPSVKEMFVGVPVLTSRRRMDGGTERSNRAQLEQFRNSGRLDDAAAILAKRMKD